jgi:hypothetical protein
MNSPEKQVKRLGSVMRSRHEKIFAVRWQDFPLADGLRAIVKSKVMRSSSWLLRRIRPFQCNT